MYGIALPGLSYEHIVDVARTIIPRKYDDEILYKVGFVVGYIKVSGNQVTTQEKELEIMGKLSNIKKEAATGGSVNNMTTLEGLAVEFCIVEVRTVDTRYGPSWIVKLLVDPSMCEALSCDDEGHTVVFIQKGSTSKDRALAAMIGQTPIHSVKVKGTVTPSGTWFDFDETHKTCVCGEPFVEDEEPAQLTEAELAQHPF